MAWTCPKCKQQNTRELWDNTGYGGDIKCNDCNHLWQHKPNARKGPVNRVTLSIRLPPDIKTFIVTEAKQLGISQGELIETWGKFIKENDIKIL